MGYAQFQRIDALVAKKRWIFEKYRELLADVPDIQLNAEPEGGANGVWITALVFGRSHRLGKAEAMERLGKLGLPLSPLLLSPVLPAGVPGLRGAIQGAQPGRLRHLVARHQPAGRPGAGGGTDRRLLRWHPEHPWPGPRGHERMSAEPALRDKRVLITGGLGFIGSNLAHRCLELGARVTIYDCLDPRSGGNMRNLHGIEGAVEVVLNDIRNFEDLCASIRGQDARA